MICVEVNKLHSGRTRRNNVDVDGNVYSGGAGSTHRGTKTQVKQKN